MENAENYISRAGFNQLAGYGLLGIFLAPILGCLDNPNSVNNVINQPERIVDFIWNQMGIAVFLGLPENEINYLADVPGTEQVNYSLGLILKALTMYPRYFLADNGLKAICLVKDLQTNNGLIRGALLNSHVGYIAVSSSDQAYPLARLDDEPSYGATHHEIAHALKVQLGDPNQLDVVWNDDAHTNNHITVNPYLEWYPDGYARYVNVQEPSWFEGTSTLDSMKNPSEDQAEWSRVLMSPKLHREMNTRIATFPEPAWQVMARKRERSKLYFSWLSDDALNNVYWDQLLADQVGVDYFY
jgi:hypothetical protein